MTKKGGIIVVGKGDGHKGEGRVRETVRWKVRGEGELER